MNVFDFDNTIYDGESSFDFFKYCVRKKPSLLKYMPKTAAMVMKYKTGAIDKTEVTEFCAYMLGILAENVADLDRCLKDFWKKNSRKLKPEILRLIKSGDVIISASPDFMFTELKNSLCGAELITTQIDLKSMKITSLCFGENKVKEFVKRYPDIVPDNYYTDNMNDAPMINFAKRALIVKGRKILEFKAEDSL